MTKTTLATTTEQEKEKAPSSLTDNEKANGGIHNQKQPNQEQHPSHKKCGKCQELLPRHVFPKKEYKITSQPTCHSCRKQQTAQRLQQPTKPPPKQGNRSGSGLKRRPNNFGYCNYVDKLFGMNCFQDLVSLQAFSSAKDVSESMAVLQAVNNHGSSTATTTTITSSGETSKPKNRLSTTCLCIGDGATPRTAVLACFLERRKQNWNHVVSIDPMMHSNWQGNEPHGVQGLYGFGGTLEDFLQSSKVDEYPNHHHEENIQGDEESIKCDFLVLLCVHSHARLIGNCDVDKIRARYASSTSSNLKTLPETILVSLPCCPKFRSQRDVGRPPDVEYEDDCVFSACRKVQVWNFPSSPLAEVKEGGHANKSSFPLNNIDGINMDYCQEVL